ncbi:MAG: hypothetical protein FJ030_18635 [Chloroflexi bacterium]|nr:hypothetical protein [Chloroflexota bacterium]
MQKRIESPSTTSVADVRAAATPGAVIAVTAPPLPATADTASSYPSQTACEHPYFPLRQGATWAYSVDGFQYTWVVNGVSGDLNSATAEVSMVFDSGAVNYIWTCTPEGVTYFQSGSVVTEGVTIANFVVSDQTGNSIPAADRLTPDAAWASGYTMQYTVQGEGFSSDVTMVVSESNTVGEGQRLDTGAGSFDVIPVITNASYTTTMTFGGTTTTTPSSSIYTTYFGYGVGMIRSDSNFNGVASTTELISYSIP